MDRHSQAAEQVGTKSWVNIAAEAAERVNYVSYGEKQNAYNEIGAEYDLSPNHVRRMVRALTFTVEIEPKHRELAKALRTVTFKAAEIIDRWFGRDPVAAVAAAKRFVAGGLSLKALTAEANGEVAPLTHAKIDQSGLDLASFREAAWKKSLAAIGCEVEEAARPEPLRHLSNIDRIVQNRDGLRRWGLIIVPPGLAASAYRARQELDLGRALALQQLGITPIFALPAEAAPADFRQMLEAFGVGAAIVAELSVMMTYG